MARSRVEALLLFLGVSMTTAIIMLATEPYLAIAWDEGYTLGREARVRSWFQALYDPAQFVARWQPPAQDEELIQWQNKVRPPRRERFDSRTELLSDPQALAWFWPFAREEPHGHPPFYALLGLAGDVLAPSWQDLPAPGWDRSCCSASRRESSSSSSAGDGVPGRRAWPPVPGCSSRTCSATDTMRATTPSWRRSGCWPSSLS